jgi:hypothetical protein
LAKPLPLNKTFAFYWLNPYLLAKIFFYLTKPPSFGKSFASLQNQYIFLVKLPFDKTFLLIG